MSDAINSPKASASRVQEVQALLKKEMAAGSDFCVLYLDDEELLFDSFQDVMAQFGFKTHATSSEEDALTFLTERGGRTALIVSDLRMPQSDGFHFRQRTLAMGAAAPFIILSGFVDRAMALQGIDLKITAFVDKPVNAETLAEILAREALPRVRAIKEDQELVYGFVAESADLIEEAEGLLLRLDQDPADLDAVNRFFGIVHTLKGASSFFQPKTLHRYAHGFEEILKRIQRGDLPPSDSVVSALLAGLDAIKALVGEIKSGQHQPHDVEKEIAALLAADLAASKPAPEAAGSSGKSSPQPTGSDSGLPRKQEEIKVAVPLLD